MTIESNDALVRKRRIFRSCSINDTRSLQVQKMVGLLARVSSMKWLEKLLVILGFCAVWQVVASVGLLNPVITPPPTSVLKAFDQLLAEGELIQDILASLKRVFIGFTAAGIVGITLGLACARVRLLLRLILPLVEAIRPISPIAWIPIAVLWFGLGDKSAAFLIYIGSFFPIFTNTLLGFSSVDPRYVRAAQVLGFGRIQFFTDVLLLSALPYIFAGLRIGIGVGWMCVVAAEMMGARNGLGYMIQMNRVIFEIPNILVGMITIGIIGFVINEVMGILEVRLLPWAEGR